MISDELLYGVATEYYIDKRPQREIAERLGVSRVQVSKYLKMAEQRGMVRVEVIPPHVDPAKRADYRNWLTRRFSVRDVVITPGYGDPQMLFRSLFRMAEEYLFSNYANNAMTVGIGWGRTMYELGKQLSPHDRSLWKVVPLSGGSSRASGKYFNVNHIVHAFGEKIDAQSQLLYLPFMTSTSATKKTIARGDEFSRISEVWDHMELIICSVGADVARSPLFQYKLVGPRYLAKVAKNTVVGDMLTHFVDLEGHVVEIGIEDKTININLSQLMKVPNKIVIASGVGKSEAILGAIRAGMVDVLISDETTVAEVRRLSERDLPRGEQKQSQSIVG